MYEKSGSCEKPATGNYGLNIAFLSIYEYLRVWKAISQPVSLYEMMEKRKV